ncbi:hypothetical protein B0H14DRAFT_2595880 [Mycena olivaceomarginata]|nr:hypothetical protein B0H14DRAFT_2595880 [Mycena olivaceomarginata]
MVIQASIGNESGETWLNVEGTICEMSMNKQTSIKQWRPHQRAERASHFSILADAKPAEWLAKPTKWLASHSAGRGRVIAPKSTPPPNTSHLARAQATFASQKEFTSSVGYTFSSVNFNLGKKIPMLSPLWLLLPTSQAGSTLRRDLMLSWQASRIGNDKFLGGAMIDAQALVDVDFYTGVRINDPCRTLFAYYGVRIDAGVTGKVLYWETGPLAINENNDQEIYCQCFTSAPEEVTINDRTVPQIEMFGGSIPEIQPSSFGPAYLEHKNATHSQKILPRSVDGLEKRGSVPFLPGFLNCPDVEDHIGADGTDRSKMNWDSPDGTSKEHSVSMPKLSTVDVVFEEVVLGGGGVQPSAAPKELAERP